MMGQIIKLLKRLKISQDLKEKKFPGKKIGEAFATGNSSPDALISLGVFLPCTHSIFAMWIVCAEHRKM